MGERERERERERDEREMYLEVWYIARTWTRNVFDCVLLLFDSHLNLGFVCIQGQSVIASRCAKYKSESMRSRD